MNQNNLIEQMRVSNGCQHAPDSEMPAWHDHRAGILKRLQAPEAEKFFGFRVPMTVRNEVWIGMPSMVHKKILFEPCISVFRTSHFRLTRPISGAGMMSGGGPGDGRGMMNGFGPGHAWAGNDKMAFADRSEALKQELKITSNEAPAWKTYTNAVTASDQSFFAAMKTAFEPNSQASVTPDDRFAILTKMIALKKQNFDVQKTAAEVLVTKLTPYQSGQAHEICPASHKAVFMAWDRP